MLKRLARLFTIKTRFEAYLVTYAIAVGAVERGRHYMEIYPGTLGWVFALLCTGVVFVAGAKLLDSVRPAEAALSAPANIASYPRGWARRPRVSRNRPRQFRSACEGSQAAPRTR
jgi:hypothetical protein